jgi:hypothetical protein
MNTSLRKIVKRRLLSPLGMVFLLVLSHPISAWAGQLHTSTLVKDVDDSFTCSASNIGPRTLEIEIAIISGGIPPEDIFRTTLTCDPGETCSIGTSPGDFRSLARCSMFFPGSERNVRGVLRTFNTRERAEAR